MIHIYCGDGKGKTTASIGLAVRCGGYGKKVLFMQRRFSEENVYILRRCSQWKGFLAVRKSYRCNQRRTPPAAQELRRNSQR